MNLSPSALERVQTCIRLIQEHQTSLEALNTYLTSVIKADTGVDIETENYDLDPSTGQLLPTIEEVKGNG